MIVKRATELKFVARFFASGFSTHRVPPSFAYFAWPGKKSRAPAGRNRQDLE
jgi:hypothetical protein